MSRTSDAFLAGAGLVLWSACFIALYGLLSIACMLPTLGLPAMRTGSVTIMLSAVWMLFIAAHVAAVLVIGRRYRAAGGEAGFVLKVGVYLNLAGLGATLFIGAPVLALPPCR
jgi:hypothetical protein